MVGEGWEGGLPVADFMAGIPSKACRAHKRAKELAARAGSAGDIDGVAAGTYVQLQASRGIGNIMRTC